MKGRYNKLAFVSLLFMIMSIVSLTPLGFILSAPLGVVVGLYALIITPIVYSIIGIILSIISIIQIKRNNLRGKILAWVSLILSSLILIFFVILSILKIIKDGCLLCGSSW